MRAAYRDVRTTQRFAGVTYVRNAVVLESPLSASPPIVPVVLCGGAGTRLWPLSRRARPKQLLPLASERSLLHDTLIRCDGFSEPVLIGSSAQRFLLTDAARRAGHDLLLIAEPEGRNTCAAAAAAALAVSPGTLVLLLPADHRVDDPDAFREAVFAGCAAALEGRIVVFGVHPDRPHTGYGWIEPVAGEGCRAVRRFVEKPDLATAKDCLAQGMLWNAGIFLFRADAFLDELETLAPEVLSAARRATDAATRSGNVVELESVAWASCPSTPIDVAVMEKTTLASVVPVDMGWSDLGSYEALHEMHPHDPAGNALVGDAVGQGATNCYLHGEDILVTAVGVSDLIVVGTPDAVVVAPRGSGDLIKGLVEGLGTRAEVVEHPRAERPWGRYRVIDRGDGFQVKRIVVRPGERLSLQLHHHRDEHWIVVAGRALVTLGDEATEHRVGGHIRVPVGVPHRVENPGAVDLMLIEVQLGSYLGEDDIVRIDDVYGRGNAD